MPYQANMLHYETQALHEGLRFIFGIDEAGRGPLAGPVVASAVWLKHHHFTESIKDSKTMTPKARERAFHEIQDKALVGLGIISEAVIDQINILNASMLAMEAAVLDLVRQLPRATTAQKGFNGHVKMLIDGPLFKSDLPYQHWAIVKGDASSLSIACASIVAKVYRDRVMDQFHQIYPHYGFHEHKGYPTQAHRHAIKKHGPCRIHRRSFSLL